MANHAPSARATAAMVVHFKKRDVSLDGKQRGRGWGVGVEFGLAATRAIKAGQEITFSYNPEDDQHPMCNERCAHYKSALMHNDL